MGRWSGPLSMYKYSGGAGNGNDYPFSLYAPVINKRDVYVGERVVSMVVTLLVLCSTFEIKGQNMSVG